MPNKPFVDVFDKQLTWMWPFGNATSSAGNPLLSLLIDAAAELVGYMVVSPVTDTIDRVCLPIGAVTQAPANGLSISLQDYDPLAVANPAPDGVLDQFRVLPVGSVVANTSPFSGLITHDGTDTGNKRSVVAGEKFFVVVGFQTFIAGDSVNLPYMTCNSPSHNMQYQTLFAGGVWTSNISRLSNILIQYTNTGWLPVTNGHMAGMAKVYSSVNLVNNGDFAGARFVPEADMLVVGFASYIANAARAGSVALYAEDKTLLRSQAFTAYEDVANSASRGYYWPEPYLCKAGSAYYVGLRRDTALTPQPYYRSFDDAAHAAAGHSDLFQWGENVLGVWTDYPLRRPTGGPIVLGGSGGGGFIRRIY